jgi:hypothetical protein
MTIHIWYQNPRSAFFLQFAHTEVLFTLYIRTVAAKSALALRVQFSALHCEINLKFEYDLATLVGYRHTKFDPFISTESRYADAGAKCVKFLDFKMLLRLDN